jgi:hypothetical protein
LGLKHVPPTQVETAQTSAPSLPTTRPPSPPPALAEVSIHRSPCDRLDTGGTAEDRGDRDEDVGRRHRPTLRNVKIPVELESV